MLYEVITYLYTSRNATLNDLYQDVVLNLWRAYPKFRGECKISTWIYRIALNTCISFIRKEKNVPEIVTLTRITSYNVCYTKLLRIAPLPADPGQAAEDRVRAQQ